MTPTPAQRSHSKVKKKSWLFSLVAEHRKYAASAMTKSMSCMYKSCYLIMAWWRYVTSICLPYSCKDLLTDSKYSCVSTYVDLALIWPPPPPPIPPPLKTQIINCLWICNWDSLHENWFTCRFLMVAIFVWTQKYHRQWYEHFIRQLTKM